LFSLIAVLISSGHMAVTYVRLNGMAILPNQSINIEVMMDIVSLKKLFLAGVVILSATASYADYESRNVEDKLPIVIGHRGTAGYLPEETLEGYAMAVEMGADYIEPDLVATKDGYLIARHEPNLIATTNVKDLPQFASRKRKAVIDGAEEEGWFASDFTLAEIKTLGAIQQLAERDQSFNGKFKVATLEEIIDLAKRKTQEKGRVIGIYPETKHPTYHQKLGLPLEDRLLAVLTKAGWNHHSAPVFIQSFETANLKYLRTKTSVRLIQLVDADDVNLDGSLAFNKPYDRPYDWTVSGRKQLFSYLLTPQGLAEVKTYADGVGPWKRYLVSGKGSDKNNDGKADDINGDGLVNEADQFATPESTIVKDAHALGLLVHAYTFRSEPRRLLANYQANPVNEYLQFYRMGVDGVFSDFADTAVTARLLYKISTDAHFTKCLVGPGQHGCGE
jgi:glycerophosphoryl diester phosphodiesterase